LVPDFGLPGAIPFQQALDAGSRQRFTPVDIRPADLAFLQYTGGTTGVAKGAMLTHRNMVANIEQATAWLRPYLNDIDETIVTALPLYHIFALTANCFTFMNIGGLNHLITNPRGLKGFVRTLRRTRFTAITGVNTLFNGLLRTPGFSDVDFSALKISLAGGAALQESVANRWKTATGSTLVEGYGLTEASPIVCVNPLDLPSYNGCIGLPVPSTDVSIRDEASQRVDAGEPGELWVRGPQVMRGYWQRPEETVQVLSAAGWLRTGDIAQMLADGYVRLLDRKKDMILVSGFNVYPSELEDIISAHPGVAEVGVIGVPDEQSGEAIMALVVRADPGVSEEDIRRYCRKLLTGYKRPQRIRFVAELPKNNIGKILRRELRARFANASQPAVSGEV
jgi:long-chain acyl-CoA synthetase